MLCLHVQKGPEEGVSPLGTAVAEGVNSHMKAEIVPR